MGKQILQLHAGMGQKVLSHLQGMCPEFNPADMFALVAQERDGEVFIAGQAVASAVSEMFGDGTCVAYNDIDAFVMTDLLHKKQRKMRLTTLEYEVMATSYENYGLMAMQPSSVYQVESTTRKGLVNTVMARPTVKFGRFRALCSERFLKSFDLNCVQVAVRLSDGMLVWTDDFEEFCATRQMLVTNPKTPLHTAVRYLRKKRELVGVYGQDEQTMELLAAAQARLLNIMADGPSSALRRSCEAQLSMGKQYAGKASALGDELSRWFSLEQTSDDRVPLYTLRAKGEPDKRLVDAPVDSLLLPTYARALHGHWKKRVCTAVIEQLEQKQETVSEAAVAVRRQHAVATPQARAALQVADKLRREHPRLVRWFAMCDYAVLAAVTNALIEAKRQHGLWVYGLLETLEWPDQLEREAGLAPENAQSAVKAWIDQQVAEALEEERTYRDTAVPVVPEIEFKGFRVRELRSLHALAEEGARLHHCVAGYVQAVRGGSCRIISLRRPKCQESLTLELRVQNGKFKSVQLRGLHNRDSTREENEVASRLVLAINFAHLLGRVGVQLSPKSFTALASSHKLLGAYSALASVFETSKKYGRSSSSARLYAIKKRLVQLRLSAKECSDYVSFIDSSGTKHSGYAGSLPWKSVLRLLLDSSCYKDAGFYAEDDLIPF